MDNRIPITRTKVIVPRRRENLLSRYRLLDLLYAFIDLKLIIVAAPAGYGKTSLVVDFIPYVKMPACWYALDPLDQDPQRFIAHFITSLSQRFPAFGQASMAALNNSNPEALDLDALITVIINDVYENVQEHFLIVLDDYHLVEESKQVTYFINQFIQLSDENSHLIICSRTLLNLPDMPLLVARSEVGGLSFEALAFTPEEIQRLWTQNFHSDISTDEAADLSQQTEGWITGVLLTHQMSSGPLADRLTNARVAGVGLYDYLAQQVLDRQPPEIQRALMRTSLLDEFDAQLCAEVIGTALGIEEDWEEAVIAILRLNLFIQQVGEERIWLRYHHLFRDFLMDRMLRNYPEEAKQIQVALAAILEKRGEWERAYEIYRQTGKLSQLPNLVEKAGPALIARGRLHTLKEWLEQLPVGERLSRPELISLQGMAAMMSSSNEEALQLLDNAIQAFEVLQNEAGVARALERRAHVNRVLGRTTQSLEDAKRALEIAQKINDAIIISDAMTTVGIDYFQMGELQLAWDTLQKSRQSFIELDDAETAAKVSMQQGLVANALGDSALSEKSYMDALSYYEESHNRFWQATLLNNLGLLQHQKGNYEAAASSFERSVRYAQAGGFSRAEAYALTSLGDMYRDINALEEAHEAYRQARPVALRINDRHLLFYLDMGEATLACLEGQAEQAERLLGLAEQAAEISGASHLKNLVRLERGVTHQLQKQSREAMRDLVAARDYFERAGHRGDGLRAHYYLAAATFASGPKQQTQDYLNKVLALSSDPGFQNLLGTSGHLLKEFLQAAQNEAGLDGNAGILLEKAVAYENKLPGLRRQLRRQTQAVPLGPPRIVVQTLGRIQVKVNNKIISSADWVAQAARDLFLMLIAHPEGMTKEEAGAILWQDCSVEELKWRFKNTIYRLRRAIGKDVIIFDEDIYRFNHALDYEEDSETFERILNLAQNSPEVERRIHHFETAAKLYRGDYLPDLNEDWVIIRREHLRKRFLDGLLKLAKLHLELRQHEKAMEAINKATDVDSCLEEAYQLGMQVNAALENWGAVRRIYDQCRTALARELGVQPSKSTQDLFESLNH
jgi:LuxR family transcriptional regulator, maltose regulon positive regulatory protein